MEFLSDISQAPFLSSGQDVIFLTDENTSRDCLPKLGKGLREICIPAGESAKNLASCEIVWDQLIRFSASRSTTLVCVGGGMVCDLGAFAASVFQRGIPHILVPTSLLAMVDAAVGGKSGVDYKNIKNYIGTFTRATATYIHKPFLDTLPQKELENGKVEMIKHGLIADRAHFESLLSDPSGWKELILDSINIKLAHTSKDHYEMGIRKRLNFGHTIGHAFESLAMEQDTELSHGLAVAVGMLAEAYLSYQHWSLGKGELEEIEQSLRPYLSHIPTALFGSDRLLYFMQKDKKNKKGQILFTLLNSIGSAQENLNVKEGDILDSLNYLQSLR